MKSNNFTKILIYTIAGGIMMLMSFFFLGMSIPMSDGEQAVISITGIAVAFYLLVKGIIIFNKRDF